MVDQGIDQMPVVDGDNRLIGIISQSDLLGALFQSKLDSVAAF
jgi:CBS domain-containing membrane protein